MDASFVRNPLFKGSISDNALRALVPATLISASSSRASPSEYEYAYRVPSLSTGQYAALTAAHAVRGTGVDTFRMRSVNYLEPVIAPWTASEAQDPEYLVPSASEYLVPSTQMSDIYGAVQRAGRAEIPRADLALGDVLGAGAFGAVQKAALAIRGRTAAATFPVAVKSLTAGGADSARMFLEEAAIMAQFEHGNVVSLIGVVTATQPQLIVLEYMAKGEW